MSLYKGSEKVSSQVNLTQYTEVSELMKYMTTEVGDIGQVMLPIDENENKRRYLNGQIILQAQFPKFTKRLKEAVRLYPNLKCTEAEWQNKASKDPDLQCGKFVINDDNGTIRLPRIKYLVGNLNLYKLGEGMPYRRLIRVQKATDKNQWWYEWYSDGYVRQGGTLMTNRSDTEQVYTFPIPFVTEPTILMTRIRNAARESVQTNTDYEGLWSATKTEFRTWGAWSADWWPNFIAEGYAEIPDERKSNITGSNGLLESPYYIQVSVGVDTEDKTTREFTTNNPYSFGMFQRSIAKLNNLSWLKSDGAYHSGKTYPDYYQWLLENYQGTRNDEIEIVAKGHCYQWQQDTNHDFKAWTNQRNLYVGAPVYGYLEKHVYGSVVSITDENTIVVWNSRLNANMTLVFEKETYSEFSFTDYHYILDLENETFRLPKLVGDESVINHSDYVPSIGWTTPIPLNHAFFYICPYNGMLDFYSWNETAGYSFFIDVNDIRVYQGVAWNNEAYSVNLPLKRGDKVRLFTDDPNSSRWKIAWQRFAKAINPTPLYFYVGETVQDANLINAGRISERVSVLEGGATRYIIETHGDHSNGYSIYNDGWIEQWGYTVPNGTDYLTTVTLYKPMRDNKYQVFVNMQYPGDGTASWQYLNGKNLTNTTFQFIQQSTTYHNWKVEGYMQQ